MHSTPLILILVLVMASACSQSDDVSDLFEQREISWTIGAEHNSDTTLQLPISSSGMATLEINKYSICPTHQLHLLVVHNSDTLLSTLSSGEERHQIRTPLGGNDLAVLSQLVPNQNDMACVWLGQATLIYHYDQ